MAQPKSSDRDKKSLSNYDVDYVIHYTIPPNESAEAEASFTQLISALSSAGFATEVRPGAKSSSSSSSSSPPPTSSSPKSTAPACRIGSTACGPLRPPLPDSNPHSNPADIDRYFAEDEPVTQAERLRLAYVLITRPRNEGGAGITPQRGQWRFVQSIFPLHDHAFNRRWISEWSKKASLDEADIEQIRERFGERVAFYFAFLQSYFAFLLFPAAFGAAAWLILGPFSWVYAVVNCLWSVVFFEHWKMKEVDLAVKWGVRGVSRIQHPRSQFRFEREGVDPVTGEVVKLYPPLKRLARQMLQVPFALACVCALGGVIAGCFAIEIFITEVYNGPFKQYLTFLPTILLTVFNPTLTTLLTRLAERLTEVENYETQDDHQAAFVQKIFVINFITSYLGIFLTAFVYVPFGKVLVPHLDIFRLTAQRFTAEGKPLATKNWQINPDRLTKQVIYFTVTAQIINLATEIIVPFAKRKLSKTVEKVQSELSENPPPRPPPPSKTTPTKPPSSPASAISLSSPSFGRSRLIAANSQRPIPWRADSIGPWLNALGFLSWMGSVTSAALVFLFHSTKGDGSPWDIKGWALLLAILFAEHLYLVVQIVVRGVVKKLDSPGLQKEKAERFTMRKRDALEEEARRLSVAGAVTPEQLFWMRQRGADETIQVGRALIAEQAAANQTKASKQ
ncbi:hypothetical protein N0V88_003088 [Collariella sp. IMI 366227]|nr:hypothetical protein N0V88_003088 [Collariella sp. IMI 366227]